MYVYMYMRKGMKGEGEGRTDEALVTSICRSARCIVNDLSTQIPCTRACHTSPSTGHTLWLAMAIYRVSYVPCSMFGLQCSELIRP